MYEFRPFAKTYLFIYLLQQPSDQTQIPFDLWLKSHGTERGRTGLKSMLCVVVLITLTLFRPSLTCEFASRGLLIQQETSGRDKKTHQRSGLLSAILLPCCFRTAGSTSRTPSWYNSVLARIFLLVKLAALLIQACVGALQ